MTVAARSEAGSALRAGNLRVQLHREPSAIESEWRGLDRSGIGTLFQRFDWNDAWLRTIGAAGAHEAAILLGELDGRPAFILPLALRRYGPATVAEWIGGTHAGYNFGLWSAEGAAHVSALSRPQLRHMLADALGADALLLRRVPPVLGGTAQPLSRLASVEAAMSGYSVSLAGGMTELLARTGGGARRRRANQKERRMREMGAFACGPVDDLPGALGALEFFGHHKALRLSEQGLANPFAEPGAMDFLGELVRRSIGASEPLLRLWSLSVDGRPRAVIGTGVDRGIATLQILTYAHDETMPHSPGQVLLYRQIEAMCEQGLDVYDFGIGREAYKDSWADTEITLRDHYLALTAKGGVAVAAMRLGDETRSMLRHNRLANRLVAGWRRRDQKGAETTHD